MLTLYIGITVLSLIFAAFITSAWLRAPEVARQQREFEQFDVAGAANVRIYRARLATLKQQYQDGLLTEPEWESARLDLERNLLEDSTRTKAIPMSPDRQGSGLLIAAGVVVLIVAGAIYSHSGNSGNLELYKAKNEVMHSTDPSAVHFISRFEEEARRQPDNPNVWAMLYPLYRDAGRYNDAVNALKRVITLNGSETALEAELAQAEFFAAGRQMTPEISQLVTKIQREDPQQPTMHSLLGFIAFTQGNYEQAISHWRTSLAGLQSENDKSALEKGIQIAQQHLTEQQSQ